MSKESIKLEEIIASGAVQNIVIPDKLVEYLATTELLLVQLQDQMETLTTSVSDLEDQIKELQNRTSSLQRY